MTCPPGEQGIVKRTGLSAALAGTVPRFTARVARFIAVSEHVAERHRTEQHRTERHHAHGPGIEVIPNFIDDIAGPYAEPAGTEVLFVGPADRYKGLPVLLEARQLLPPALARATRTVVIGAAGSEPGVTYTGRLTGDPLWQRYREAAVVAVPPIWPDPCPTVVLEALAHGRPVVGSRAGGIPDLVIDGVTGLLVPPGNPQALAKALVELLTDQARLRVMGRVAHERARAFRSAAVVPRIEAVYQSVLAGVDPA